MRCNGFAQVVVSGQQSGATVAASLPENDSHPGMQLAPTSQEFPHLPHNGCMQPRWKPSVTVAAVIEQSGRFLLVEEHTADGLRLNNPAGHLDPGESPAHACAREALEETAHQFTPESLVGIYLARFQRPLHPEEPGTVEDITYLRFAFCGSLGAFDAKRKLDDGIVRTVWLSAQEMRDNAHRMRSPLVLQCMEDYLAGRRFDMGLIHTHPSVQALQAGT